MTIYREVAFLICMTNDFVITMTTTQYVITIKRNYNILKWNEIGGGLNGR